QGNTSSLQGSITDNAALVFQQNTAGTFAGAISGTGSLTQSGSGALSLTGANTYSGGTMISAGMIQGDTTSLHGSIIDNATLVFKQTTDGLFTGNFAGSGVVTKAGTGTLFINGNNAFAGTTTVQSGTLEVGDSSSPTAFLGGNVQVGAGGTLRGHGSIGGNVINGGMLWAGGSIGTLTVNGNYTQQAGGVFTVDATPDGQASELVVGGKASLGGNALVLAQAGNWAPRTDYTILTAAGGVSGQFASASSSLVFLNPVLSYSANAVNLSLQRNDINFTAVTQTPNQTAVAGAANSLGFGSAVYSALVVLSAPAARHAFDQLSGEIHASTRSALDDDDRYVREAINQHLLGMSNNANGLSASTASGVAAWSSAWTHGGHHDGDGNASYLAANGSGLLVGADLPVGASSRLGAVIGTGQSTTRADTLGSSSHVLNKHVGLYGSTHAGEFQLQGGAAYGWQTVNTNRIMAFGDFSGMASSRYHATTQQAYVDGSYAMTWNHATLAPFINVAQQRLHTDAITESGTAAALDVNAQDSAQTYGTLGLRGSFALDPSGGLHANASVGWQHAWGDLTSRSTMRFASGGGAFDIAGVPVARNAMAISGGISFTIAPNVSVDATYSGQFASRAKDQSARMSLTWAF
ncbi:MAG TPA: autotransporter domain-containing protein, partial [Rhodanobacter sp.]|nr:autotransporter domain-containing protein [Rhodanobacter sp.]